MIRLNKISIPPACIKCSWLINGIILGGLHYYHFMFVFYSYSTCYYRGYCVVFVVMYYYIYFRLQIINIEGL